MDNYIYPSLLNPHLSGNKGKDNPGRISQKIGYSACPVGNKGLMDLIRKTVKYSNYNKNEIGSKAIIKIHVPWIGCNHQGYAEEKIGSTVEQKIIEIDQIKRKMDFFKGRNIKKDPCHDKGRKSVCNLFRKPHHLITKIPLFVSSNKYILWFIPASQESRLSE